MIRGVRLLRNRRSQVVHVQQPLDSPHRNSHGGYRSLCQPNSGGDDLILVPDAPADPDVEITCRNCLRILTEYARREVPRGRDGIVRRGKGGEPGGWHYAPYVERYAKGTIEDRRPDETAHQWAVRLARYDLADAWHAHQLDGEHDADTEPAMYSVETDAVIGAAQTIAAEALERHVGLSQSGRLGTELTLPEPDAHTVADELRARGYEVVVEPAAGWTK